jgi:hypothetical protein
LVTLIGCGGGGNDKGGTIQLTASGEVLALGGYTYPPADMNSPAFVDGWDVKFEKVLVTVDHITFSEMPDLSPTDESQTGKVVAGLDGPWAIDLHAGGPLPGEGGAGEQAYPLATLANQNLNGNAPFDATVRYAFGFDIVPATASATKLQMDPSDADYAEMVAKGWTVLYVGTATWKGGTGCTSSLPAFDFSQLPSVVKFRFGFKTPASYINCQNPRNDPAKGLGDEEHQRGIQVKGNQTVVAQLTVHTDHPFWESIVHDSRLHFDALAALAVKDAQGNYVVTLDNTVGVNYTAFKFQDASLPWRSCLDGYTPPTPNPQMGFDSLSIPYRPGGDPGMALRDFADYLAYNQSTQGHLNADGLCFVERHYPSPF